MGGHFGERLFLHGERSIELDTPDIKRTVFVLPAWLTKNKEARVMVLNDVAQRIIDGVRGQHGSPVPRGAGAGCARGIQARSGARCSGDRQSRCGGESDSRLTRNSRENHSKVGSVMCKSLKSVGGKGGTRTLDPGIMSPVVGSR